MQEKYHHQGCTRQAYRRACQFRSLIFRRLRVDFRGNYFARLPPRRYVDTRALQMYTIAFFAIDRGIALSNRSEVYELMRSAGRVWERLELFLFDEDAARAPFGIRAHSRS